MTTKKRLYEKPTMKVVKLQQQPQLLAGSNGQAGVQNYDWHDEEEE